MFGKFHHIQSNGYINLLVLDIYLSTIFNKLYSPLCGLYYYYQVLGIELKNIRFAFLYVYTPVRR